MYETHTQKAVYTVYMLDVGVWYTYISVDVWNVWQTCPEWPRAMDTVQAAFATEGKQTEMPPRAEAQML